VRRPVSRERERVFARKCVVGRGSLVYGRRDAVLAAVMAPNAAFVFGEALRAVYAA
jgi:hypothetical protein